ncbi:MAG: aldo/keto reductase [Peptococcaceae bacterium]|nr:aldo/keto reductase [Peptococcaceae bacterium]
MRLRIKGLNLPTLGYGCYGLGGAYGKPPETRVAVRLLQNAHELGIRFFDTADGYGDTESLLAKAFKTCRHEVFLATKMGPGKGGQFNLIQQRVIAACNASLQNLGTDYIDLYQIHFDDPHTPVYDTVAALKYLQQAGKIREYGIGHLPFSRTTEYLKTGSPSTVMVEVNAVSLSRYNELSALLQRHDFSIIAFSATARGLLTQKVTEQTVFAPEDIRSLDPQFRGAKLASGLEMAKWLGRIGIERDKTPSQIALAWVMGKTGVDVVLTGPKDPHHLQENCEVLNWRLDISAQRELDDLAQRLAAETEAEVEAEVDHILSSPLPPCEHEAAKDLIYALEYVAERGVTSLEEVSSLFRHLLSTLQGKPTRPLTHVQESIRKIAGVLGIQ